MSTIPVCLTGRLLTPVTGRSDCDIRHLGETGLMPSSVTTMMHGVRGFFRFAHIDGLIPADPAVYARLPKVHQDETRTQAWTGSS